MWCGNHIGHHSVIENNCFLAGQVVVSGVTKISANCFIGVNAVIMPGVKIGKGAVVASGSVVTSNVKQFTMVSGNPAKIVKEFV